MPTVLVTPEAGEGEGCAKFPEFGALLPRHFPREIQAPDLAPVAKAGRETPVSMLDAEREAILEALRRSNGNKAQAARLLGIHRGTIYVKIRQFGLSV